MASTSFFIGSITPAGTGAQSTYIFSNPCIFSALYCLSWPTLASPPPLGILSADLSVPQFIQACSSPALPFGRYVSCFPRLVTAFCTATCVVSKGAWLFGRRLGHVSQRCLLLRPCLVWSFGHFIPRVAYRRMQRLVSFWRRRSFDNGGTNSPVSPPTPAQPELNFLVARAFVDVCIHSPTYACCSCICVDFFL